MQRKVARASREVAEIRHLQTYLSLAMSVFGVRIVFGWIVAAYCDGTANFAPGKF